MANVFIDTTLTNVGNGTYASPYNYFNVSMLANKNKLYITAQSRLPVISITGSAMFGCTIIGYDPMLNGTLWTTDDDISPNEGPVIDASGHDYGIDFNGLTDTNPIITLRNIRIFNWELFAYSDGSVVNIDETILIVPTRSYQRGWKRITLRAI